MGSKLGFGAALFVVLAGAACGSEGSTTASASAEGSAKSSAKPASSGSAAPAATTAAPANTAEPKKEEGVTFTKRAPAVGDTDTSVSIQTMKMKLEGKEPMELDQARTIEKIEECLVVTEKRCTKMKVTFTKYEEIEKVGDKEKKNDVLNGKVYTVEQKGDDVEILTEKGEKISGPENKELVGMYDDVGGDIEIVNALPDGPVKVGDSLDEVAKAVAGRMQKDKVIKTTKIDSKVVVKSIKEEGGKTIVTLDVNIVAEGEGAATGKIKSEMKGTVDVRTDTGASTAQSLEGPFEMAMPMGNAKGTMTKKTTNKLSY